MNKIDQLANSNFGERKTKPLYKAAKNSKPLSLEAAELLKKHVSSNDSVILTSGFPIPPTPKPETDGPPGIIILAKAFEELGIKPILLGEKLYKEIHRGLTKVASLDNIEFRTLPIDSDKSEEICSALIKEYEPSAIISVEKPGMGRKNNYYDMNGRDITDLVGKVDYLFWEAEKRNILTIGVGDRGNEIGMGNIARTVRKNLENNGIVASQTTVDSLMVSTVSNWGAYAISAGLSILHGEMLIHQPEIEERMIRTCVKLGSIDGLTKKSEYSVDGISGKIHEKIVKKIRLLIKNEI